MSVLTRSVWEAWIPHAGSMALIDAVVDWSETTIHAIGERYAPEQHPLRSESGLHVVHLIEYGAQATAVHGALLASAQGEARLRAGRLVSVRDVRFAVEYIDLSEGRLDIHADRFHADDRGAQYTFNVGQNGKLYASGRVTVMYADA
ncbi:MAG TPA: phosphotransferase [Dyella sp.]|nr:phosphotransferase [Dyella sp.]